jgi:hypothetical protein
MKRLLILAFLFGLWALPASAAIAFVRKASNTAASGTDVVITMTVTAGDTIVVTACINTTTNAVSTVFDSGGSTYTKRTGVTNGGAVGVAEEWSTSAGGALSSSTITVRYTTSGSARKNAIAADYSGVVALGLTATNAPANSNNPTISLTTRDPNNFVVSGFAVFAADTYTAQTGNLREQVSAAGAASSLTDNTAASASSVTDSNTITTSRSWAAVALELRSTLGAPPGLMMRGVGD